MNKLNVNFLKFLQEIIINESFQKKYIDQMKNDFDWHIKEHLNKDQSNASNKLSNLPSFLSLANMSSTYEDISLRAFVVMHLSIFEYSLWNIVNHLWMKKDKIFTNIKKINNYLELDTKEVIWNSVYVWLSEFVLRRNLYIHNNGIIDDNYMSEISRHNINIDDYFDSSINTLWSRLKIPNYMYILEKNLSIVSILFVFTALIVKKRDWEDDFKELLNSAWSMLLTNPWNEAIITTCYVLLNKKINLSNYINFTLVYIESLYMNIDKFKKIDSCESIRRDIYNSKAMLILNNTDFNNKELLYYYAINWDSTNFTELICNDLSLNKRDDLITYAFKNELVAEMFVENWNEIMASLESSWIRVNVKKIHDTLLSQSNYNLTI